MKINKKGFTLVELLIVIGILAVLSTATVLVLNPAEILKESRDAQRFNDLSSVGAAISLVMATATTPVLNVSPFACTTYLGASIAGATKYITAGTTGATIQTGRANTGGGWVSVNFTTISGGVPPFAQLPIDPTNNTAYSYQYACNSTATQFELDAKMESAKYQAKAANTSDGGNATDATVYETGSIVSL